MRRARAGRKWGRGRVVVVAVVALLLVGGGGAFALTRQGNSAAPTLRTVPASLQTMQQTVTSTGTIEPATQADLSFQQSGTVQTVPVHVGEHVTKGQTLATIDGATLRSQVTLAQAQVTQARTQVTAASGGTATQVASANAQLAAAQAKLSSAQSALSQTALTSPIDGVVASVNIAVGANVGSGSSGAGSSSGASGRAGAGGSGNGSGSGSSGSSSTGSADISVISTSSWVVDEGVSSADLPRIKTGLEAQILPTGSRQPIFGTVSSIGLVASSSTSGTAQFPVTIAVTGHPTGLYAGTTASVSIIVRQLQNVLAIPTAAIHTSDSQTVVTVLNGSRQVTTPITIGQIFGSQTQVTAGLSAGQQVVLPTTTGRPGGTTGTGGTGGSFTRNGGFGGGLGGGGFGGCGFGGCGFGGGRTGSGARNGG